MMIARVTPQEESELDSVAQKVTGDLTYAGLSAVCAGDSWTGSADEHTGFVVYYDPSADEESGGVFVRWRPSRELMAAVRDPGADGTALRVGAAATEAMEEALVRILEALGWRVESEINGMRLSSFRVRTGEGPGPNPTVA